MPLLVHPAPAVEMHFGHDRHDRPFPAPRLEHRASRCVAQAAGAFEHLLFGRTPISVTVAIKDESMVVTMLESFSPLERRLSRDDAGRRRVDEFHRALFDSTLDALRDHVRQTAGVDLRGAVVHVDAETGSITKTLSTDADIDLYLLGRGLPALGVPVDVHVHASGADGKGPVRH